MGEGSSGPRPAWPADAGEGEVTRTFPGREPGTRPTDPADSSPHPPTDIVPFDETTDIVPFDIVPFEETTEAEPSQQAAEVVRYGPGVPATPPASQAGLTAEHIWRTGLPP